MTRSTVCESLPAFDEIHVVSDLHLGGDKNFQVFNLGATLGKFITHLSQQPEGRDVAFVINGDFVDFLSHATGSRYLDPEGAIGILSKITQDSAFAPVWKALAKFVKTPARTLVVVLGNHDLELALPWVQAWLRNFLAGHDAAARGRVMFSCEGAGFACTVGGKKVLCVHGNEVDAWNLTDYEQLRRVSRDITFGHAHKDWTPNAGTKLVVDVMNGVKATYPFVDLLKPEAQAAVPTLVALNPGSAGYISRRIVPIAARLTWDKVRSMTGFLSTRSAQEAAEPETFDHFMGQVFARPASDSRALLQATEARLQRGDNPLDLIKGDQQEAYLGKMGALFDWIQDKPRSEVLRAATEGLLKDTSFKLDEKDSTFTSLDQQISADIDFLIAGHTHFERAIVRQNGGGYYFNCGTWIRLMQYTPEMLSSETEFAKVFKTLGKKNMAALDVKLAFTKPACVRIQEDNGQVYGALLRINQRGKPNKVIHQFP